jgi:murein DD-endopeptidase MepM/ murein hydrolase activator NlpD
VPRDEGILHKVSHGETLATIVGQYDDITTETALAYRPNALRDGDTLEAGRYVLLPGAKRKPPPPPPPPPEPDPTPVAVTRPGGGTSVGAPPSSGGRFSLPLGAWRGVSDPFGVYRGEGRIHEGIDLDLWGLWSSPIFSACNGVVIKTEYLTYSYGYHVVVDCGDGWTTLYAHMSAIHVTPGERVSQGTQLGVSGVTGYTTGEHLHFEIRYFGAPVNPADYLGF